MGLREELLQPEKPPHQFHDEASLLWIKDHRPDLPSAYEVNPRVVSFVSEAVPWNRVRNSWFVGPLVQDGLHGVRHLTRVAIHAVEVGAKVQPDISDTELAALMWAGLFHDCRRNDDNEDAEHGRRGAEWLSEHSAELPEELRNFLPAIRFSIAVHNDNYEKIEGTDEYEQFRFFTDVLKAADAFDRYRFPREDWWFLQKFVKIEPTKEQLAFAFDFAYESERAYFKTKDNVRALVGNWKKFE